jgi:hypothetical protein
MIDRQEARSVQLYFSAFRLDNTYFSAPTWCIENIHSSTDFLKNSSQKTKLPIKNICTALNIQI